MEGDDGVGFGFFGESLFDHFEERLRFLSGIDDHFSAEEPVSGVFRVGLSHVEAFYISWVAFKFFLRAVRGREDFFRSMSWKVDDRYILKLRCHPLSLSSICHNR